MKIKFVLLILGIGAISAKGFAINTDPKQESKKSTKLKYDFTIFKLFSVDNQKTKSDSTKITLIKSPIKKED